MSAANRRRQIDDLCHAALERDPAARAAFVATACGGDEALRREVEALLAHAQTAAGFLEMPLAALAAQALTDASLLGGTLGSYQIRAHLGSGGMGDVYRARDPRLEREVAIKILPKAVRGDPERVARFEREAKLLASLNHPNIAGIHGLERANGEQFIVMELVDGETLADRLARGAIPVDETLQIAGQIADALEAAHETGIIHRDLKPANIKVRPDGTVKVLDFGLAKAVLGDDAVTVEGNVAATREGTLLGTAPYMSPEQARGHVVDKRADIWAFGCVLYEMLTGRALFAGKTTSDVIAAILDREPNWTAIPSKTPPAVVRLLHRSLTKDHHSRLSDMAMARIELRDAEAESREGVSVSVKQRRPFWRGSVALYGSLVLVAIVMGLAAWWVRRPVEAASPVVRFFIESSDLNTDAPTVAISPDGSHVAYVANQRLFIRALNQLVATPLAGTEGAINEFARAPFFSPDGQWIAFWQRRQLKRVPVSGGTPVAICDVGNVPSGASWAPDGEILFGTNEGALRRVPATGGVPEPVVALKEGERATNPQALPGGQWILFTLRRPAAGPADRGQIVVQSRSTDERRVLIEGASDARYFPSGHIVYERDNAMLAQRFNLDRLTISSEAVPLLDQIATEPRFSRMQFVVSSTGTAVYVPTSAVATPLTRLAMVERDGTKTTLAEINGMAWYPRFSPDGSRVAYGVSAGTALNEASDLWVVDIARLARTRVTFSGNNRFLPIWTPDGTRLTFADGTGDTNRLLWALADGSGQIEVLLDDGERHIPTSWSRDGRTLAFYAGGSSKMPTRHLWMLRIDGDRRTTTPFLVTPFEDRGPVFSPNGRWVAYVSDRSGETEIYARPFAAQGGDVTISVGGGREPVWEPSGRHLFYRHDGKLLAVPIEDKTASLIVGAPIRIFDDPFRLDTSSARGGVANYDISPNGQRFVMVEEPKSEGGVSPVGRLHVIVNWLEELKQRVPAR